MSSNLRAIVELDRVEMENRTLLLEQDNQRLFSVIETYIEQNDRQMSNLASRIENLER